MTLRNLKIFKRYQNSLLSTTLVKFEKKSWHLRQKMKTKNPIVTNNNYK